MTTAEKHWEFGPPQQRLSIVLLSISATIVALFCIFVSPTWKKIEQLKTTPDYRVPYCLSKDYWLYQRWTEKTQTNDIYVVGDSVVWGEYVRRDGTLSHFLNQAVDETAFDDMTFVNAGVNGLHPLALEGLIRHYGHAIKRGKVLLHCNLLWLSSPEADLSTSKEQSFNHADLAPQFTLTIPCYRQSTERRLGIVMQRSLSPLRWVSHLQQNYFDGHNIPDWLLLPGDGYPPSYPNSFKNPFAQINLKTKDDPVEDPQRGPTSGRHRSWHERGMAVQEFEWVPLAESLQWAAYKRLVQLLRKHDNDLLVVIGPFNEHMLSDAGRTTFSAMRGEVRSWLESQPNVRVVTPTVLDSGLYGDASHPLTDGYRELADTIARDESFGEWAD